MMNMVKSCCVFPAIILLSNFISSLCGWKIWVEELDWWQTTTIYQINPSSFLDADGDGIGDLKGIESKLDYLVETGINTILLSPVYTSPMNDIGYDVSNYYSIDLNFGTLEDFKSLVKAVRKKGMHLLMDFIPNHTSVDHDWFIKSVEEIEPYKDYYIWKDGKYSQGYGVPNNWLNVHNGSAWTWNAERSQYYFHQFSSKEPDLNLRNSDVQNEIKNIMKFWMDLGVDGFRIRDAKYLMEDPEFRNESCICKCDCDYISYSKMNHNHTTDWPTTYDLISDWRKFVDEYSENSSRKHTRIIVTESYTSTDRTMEYYGNETSRGSHFPSNLFLVLGTDISTNSISYINEISEWYDNMPNGQWGNWMIGNQDHSRVASRVGNEMVDAIFMMSMMLPGTVFTYQGDELGQPDTPLRRDQISDTMFFEGTITTSRDPQRGPFLWDASENAGFSTCRYPWQAIHPSFWELNLEVQKEAMNSHYKVFKQILELRKTNTIQRGNVELYYISKWVFAFTRRLPGNETIVVVLNVGSDRAIISLGEYIPKLPHKLYVVVKSINSRYCIGEKIETNMSVHESSKPLIMRPKESVALSSSEQNSPLPTVQPQPQNSSSSVKSRDAVNVCYVVVTLLVVITVMSSEIF